MRCRADIECDGDVTVLPGGLKRRAVARRVIVDRPPKSAPAALADGSRPATRLASNTTVYFHHITAT
jgi:hypothetical protein